MSDSQHSSSAGFASFDVIITLTPSEQVRFLDQMIHTSIRHTIALRRKYRFGSLLVRLTVLSLGAAATILLGFSRLDTLGKIAFSFTALITLANALEPFLNLRSIWIIQEDTLWKFRQLHEQLRFNAVGTSTEPLSQEKVRDLFDRYEEIWAEASNSWIKERQRPQWVQ